MTASDNNPCKKCGTSDRYAGGRCKKCRSNYNREYSRKNRDRLRAAAKERRESNPQKYRKMRRGYYKKRQKQAVAYARKWKKENPEKHREHNRKSRIKNIDKVKKRDREWQINNPDKVKANNHRYRTRKSKAGGSFTAKEWRALCDQYDNRCCACGKRVKLEADHVIPVVRGGSSNISNIQPLCKLCNTSKGTRIIDYRTEPIIKRWIQKRLL